MDFPCGDCAAVQFSLAAQKASYLLPRMAKSAVSGLDLAIQPSQAIQHSQAWMGATLQRSDEQLRLKKSD
ncbi:MAG: hypothetical protein Fur0043_03490 [Anaerolineales bacterium]